MYELGPGTNIQILAVLNFGLGDTKDKEARGKGPSVHYMSPSISEDAASSTASLL